MAMGISFFAVLIVTTINMMPADIDTFTMNVPEHENEVIRFAKQTDGGWEVIDSEEASRGRLFVDGTKITIKGEDEEITQDTSEILGLDEETDWDNLKEFKMRQFTVRIDRRKDGLTYTVTGPEEDEKSEHIINVSWGEDKKGVK